MTPSNSSYSAVEAFPSIGRFAGLLPALFLVLPSLIWVSLHRGLWPADACANGLKAASLHFALTSEKVSWWQAMSDIGSRRPPLLPWLAQFLVPIGELAGNIDLGLLLLPILAQFAALVLTLKALDALFHRRALALLGCLAMASAPVVVEVGKQLQTQPLQLLAAAWFLYIMALAPRWSPLRTVLHLVAAASFAVLTMLSTPAFGVVLSAAALYQALKRERPHMDGERPPVLMFAAALILASLALLWTCLHGRDSLSTASAYYHFPWGAQVQDVFHWKLLQWLDYLRNGFFLLPSLAITITAASWALASYAIAAADRGRNEARAALLVLLQAAVVLILFASSQQQTFRYTLPFAPLVAVLLAWSLFQVNRGWMTAAVSGVFLLQFALVQARDYGLVHFDRRYGEGASLRTSRDRRLDSIDGILEVVSKRPVAPVMIEMRALSMDGEHVSYEAAKRREFASFFESIATGTIPPVHSADKVLVEIVGRESSPGPNGDGLEAAWKGDALWKGFLERELGYFVMPNQEIRRRHFEMVKDAALGPLVAERLSLELSERVADSALFEKVPAPGHPELEIYWFRR